MQRYARVQLNPARSGFCVWIVSTPCSTTASSPLCARNEYRVLVARLQRHGAPHLHKVRPSWTPAGRRPIRARRCCRRQSTIRFCGEHIMPPCDLMRRIVHPRFPKFLTDRRDFASHYRGLAMGHSLLKRDTRAISVRPLHACRWWRKIVPG